MEGRTETRNYFFIFLISISLLLNLTTCLKPHGCGPMDPPVVPKLNVTNSEDYELKQVSLVFRHGDRLMYQDARCWPNDAAVWNCSVTYLSHPNANLSSSTTNSPFLFRRRYMNGRNYYQGNCQTGQLTDRGYLQELAVGQMYRNVYVNSQNFLPSSFDPSVTYFRSDQSDRCVQSLQAIFMGMYPESTFGSSSSVPLLDINTMDSFYDNIVPNGNLCPLWSEYTDEAARDPSVIQHWETFTAPLLKALSPILGYNATNWGDFQQIHDCLVVHSCHDQPIPSGVTQELYDLVMEEYGYYYHLSYAYPDTQTNAQSGIGYLLQELVEDFMLPVTKNQSPYKLLFFSGHDTTVLPILTALGLWDGHIWAHYASQMQFEVYQNNQNNGFYVRVNYNGEALSIPGCNGVLCDWNTFYQIVSKVFPVEGQCTPSYYSHYY